MDARKIFVKTTATGAIPALGGPLATASVTLNPLVVHMGVSYRF
jgi:outer membrane protein